MKPHYITCHRHSAMPDVLDYSNDPAYTEQDARDAAAVEYPISSRDAWVYSHTLFVRPGAHGRPVVEYIEFEPQPAPKPEPGRVHSWN